MLFLLHLNIAGVMSLREKYSFVLYFDVMKPIYEVDIVLNCNNSKWKTEDEMDHTLNCDKISSSILTLKSGMVWYL